MARTTFAPLAILLLLLAPTAIAGWFTPDPVEVHLPPLRDGDLLRLNTSWAWVPAEGEPQTGREVQVLLLEGGASARDRFGILRDTFAMRVDHVVDGQVTFGERCHQHATGAGVVRREVLFGSHGFGTSWESPVYSVGLLGMDSRQASFNTTPLAYFWGNCPTAVTGVAVAREGDRVRLDALFPGADYSAWAREPLSEPAERTTFHGRDALRLRYDLRALSGTMDGHLEYVLADGLPGIVAYDVEARSDAGWAHRYRSELEAYEPGQGLPLVPAADATLPSRHPAARTLALDPLAVDDDAYAPAYPYAEAMANLLADPRVSLRAFLRDNPDARLVYAWYDREARNSHAPTESTDGGWSITVGIGDEARNYYTSRARPVDAERQGLPALPKETRRVDNFDLGEFDVGWSVPAYDGGRQAVDSASLLALARTEGLGDVKTIWFGLFPEQGRAVPYVALRDVSASAFEGEGAQQGMSINLGVETGALTSIYAAQKVVSSETFLPLGAAGGGTLGQADVSTLAALAGPGLGAGLAGGAAATGLALLIVLLKFLLVPLFTRLKRDALLDNPVRARLYERVRGDAGIHLADLVDFAGIGYGATRHHLEHLVKARLLTELEVDGYKRYYASGEVPPALARRAAVLRSETTRRVYDLLVAEPDLSLREAGRRLDLSAPSVHRIKKRLEKEGLLPAEASVLVASS